MSVIASLGRVVTVAALATLACGTTLADVASASCAAPVLAASPTTVVPGQRVTVTGQNWTADCNDTVNNGATPPPARPGAAHLVFVQAGHATPLTDVVADARTLTFRVTVDIPESVHKGAATIEATGKIAARAVSLHVTGATPTRPATPELPFTGARETPMIVLATLLLVIGAALFSVGIHPRRR